MNITLETWARKHYSPAPTLPTLRAWARSGHIQPAPEKVGRTWYVDENAVYIARAGGATSEQIAAPLSDRAAELVQRVLMAA